MEGWGDVLINVVFEYENQIPFYYRTSVLAYFWCFQSRTVVGKMQSGEMEGFLAYF